MHGTTRYVGVVCLPFSVVFQLSWLSEVAFCLVYFSADPRTLIYIQQQTVRLDTGLQLEYDDLWN